MPADADLTPNATTSPHPGPRWPGCVSAPPPWTPPRPATGSAGSTSSPTFALRMKALADDPTVPLFFGRLDYADAAVAVDGDVDHRGERFHIGRRHVSDEVGDPMVVDWRAPVSLPFYRASRPSRWASTCAGASASSTAS